VIVAALFQLPGLVFAWHDSAHNPVTLAFVLLAFGASFLLLLARTHPGATVVAIAVLTPILGYLGALKPEPHDRSNVNWEALYWTIGVVVVALVWFLILIATRRSRVDAAASHAAEHRGVAPLDEGLEYEPLPENEMPL